LLRPPSGGLANVPPPNFWSQRADVQRAIHARVGTKWTECSRALNYTMQKQNMLVYLQEFFVKRPDLKILYYSGGTHWTRLVPSAAHHCPFSPSHPQHHVPPRPLDVDIATVPFAYTQYCLNGLQRPIVKRWKYAVPPIGPSPRSV
jgi:hypothetical protein